MIIKDVVTIHIRDKPRFVGCIYNDKSGTFEDGQTVVLPPCHMYWKDSVGNTFAASIFGNIYQIEFWREN